MTMRLLLLPVVALLLAGCWTTGQLAQRDSERCVARGYRPDTPDFKKCLVEVETERQTKMDARHREMLERSAIPGR